MYCGEVAVFPCCVTFVTALTIYCCGRMSGLWLRESYLWSFWNRLRLLCGCHPPPLKLHANPCGLVIKESSAHVFRTVQVWFGLLLYGTGVFFNVDPLYQPFPQVSGYVRHPISAAISCPVNSTVDIQTSVQMLKPGVAMVSYWADVSNVLGNTTNVTIPDMSPFFPTFGFAFLVWGGTLFYLALFPWIILVVCVVVGYIFMFFDLFVWETPQPSRASPAITFCACAPWIAALRVLIHYMIGPLMWYLLPWPLTQFLLPEHLQLPGIFLILTIIIAKMYYQWIRHVRVQWKNGEFTAIVRLFNQLRTAAAQVNNESGEKDSLVGIAASVPRS
ncbi:uncharacterized protein LOC129592301 [Paramacrobiotus metropolitanus]|uniref:uncharacterized protein LOC129592301 n=1 Tax=Paramacrobiotus metropolitanus TaxID=2943436 RepID=UPI00244620A8|nr:uncharacterized protein LOC129592301 [Paramacrobiotus metropolitanus]